MNRKISESSYLTKFTLIELLVVIAIIAILAGMLLPALSQARDRGKTIKCAAHMKSMSTACIQYNADNNDYVPFGYNSADNTFSGYGSKALQLWYIRIAQYMGYTQKSYWQLANDADKVKIYKCVSPEKDPARNIYSISYFVAKKAPVNGFFQNPKLLQIPHPSDKYFLEDVNSQYPEDYNPSYSASNNLHTPRHNNGSNFHYLDGHVAWKKYSQNLALAAQYTNTPYDTFSKTVYYK